MQSGNLDKKVQGQLMESNQMSLVYESQLFDKREGEGGRLGCTLVTGFLGSGKTTLVHHILHNRGDLRIAVLVNEFAEIDIDSLLLDAASMNAALGLPALSLSSGCACCTISGNMENTVRSVLNSKHNFDYLIIETSGVADPQKIAEDLEAAGVHLDMIVTVVDAEALDSILDLPVAKKQLAVADIVLINKCDVASLSLIANAEDRVEMETGGTKAVRCRFCKVPLSLVINVPQEAAPPPLGATMSNSISGFLSHEAMTTGPLSSLAITRAANNWVSVHKSEEQSFGHRHRAVKKSTNYDPPAHATSMFVSSTFSSNLSITFPQFQDIVVKQMHGMKGLLRAKGVIWLSDFRRTRFLFHWSGKKRVEAVYGGKWDSSPHTRLVFIGRNSSEIQQLIQSLDQCSKVDDKLLEDVGPCDNGFSSLRQQIGSDKRFKVYSIVEETQTRSFTFGLVPAPLRGVNEADLNAALMRLVNGRGVVFLAGVTSRKEDHVLQLSVSRSLSADAAWKEILSCATMVLAKGFKDVCPCRCDMTMHTH